MRESKEWQKARLLKGTDERFAAFSASSTGATNPECFNADGTWKKGKRQQVFSSGYRKLKQLIAESERKLAAERKRSHGELANDILSIGKKVKTEKLILPEKLRPEREGQGTRVVHETSVPQKKPLSQRWHVLKDGSGIIQRDAFCSEGNRHHPPRIKEVWEA